MSTGRKQYGTPLEHHIKTATLWSTYLDLPIDPEQVSMMFILDKIARHSATQKPDNVVDIAGYAQVHAIVQAEMEEGFRE